MVKTFTFCQGSLGHSWPSVVGTNLTLRHLQGLPRRGAPNPDPNAPSDRDNQWCIGFKKEIAEALDGKVKTPSLEEMDSVISEALHRDSQQQCSSEEVGSSQSGESGEGEKSLVDNQDNSATRAGASVSSVEPAGLEAWRAHIMRGHLPYRRDCQYALKAQV